MNKEEHMIIWRDCAFAAWKDRGRGEIYETIAQNAKKNRPGYLYDRSLFNRIYDCSVLLYGCPPFCQFWRFGGYEYYQRYYQNVYGFYFRVFYKQ